MKSWLAYRRTQRDSPNIKNYAKDEKGAASQTNFPPTEYPVVDIDYCHEIRVAKLHPGKQGDEVRCTLVVQRLAHTSDGEIAPLDYPTPGYGRESTSGPHTTTAYDALSYCWGSFEDHSTIQLNNVADFPVSANLHAALRRLRQNRGPPLRIWVDQICINQHNIAERSRQVSVMANIFNQADRVFVWLGDTSLSARPMSLPGPRLESQLYEALEQTPHWWTRAWVVPEFLAARFEPVIVFGPCMTPCGHLYLLEASNRTSPIHGSSYYSDDKLYLCRHINSLLKLRRAYQENLQSDLMFDLASFGSVLPQTKCSDARDKIYSTLPFIDNLKHMLRPDYAHSVPHVFSETTHLEILTTSSFKTLSLIYLPSKRRSRDLPTWTVDFTFSIPKGPPTRSDSFDLYDFGMTFSGFANLFAFRARPWTKKASNTLPYAMYEQGNVACSVYETEIPPLLRFLGLAFDTILCVVELCPVDANAAQSSVSPRSSDSDEGEPEHDSRYYNRIPLDDLEKEFCDILREALVGCQPYEMVKHGAGGVDIGPDHFRSRLASQNSRRASLRILIAVVLFEAWCQDIGKTTAPMISWLESVKPILHKMDIWDSYFEYASDGRALFITSAGFIGLAPRSVQEGDRVILPYGSRTPMLVRPSGEYVTFQGFAYVNGIMDDELCEKYPDIELREEELRMV